jgi:hypothetical protein
MILARANASAKTTPESSDCCRLLTYKVNSIFQRRNSSHVESLSLIGGDGIRRKFATFAEMLGLVLYRLVKNPFADMKKVLLTLLGLLLPFTAPAAGSSGSLQVTIIPAGAITNGAQWRVDGGTLKNSGATVSNLSVGNHTVSFSTIYDWTTPSNQTVSVSANSTNTALGTYVLIEFS